MERSNVFPISKKKISKTKALKNIIQEYSLKRNKFNPATTSPNLFINKLEIRMKLYYDHL